MGRMNAIEIEEAASALAGQLFDAAEFPFASLAAFGNTKTTIKRLRKRDTAPCGQDHQGQISPSH